MKRFQRSQRRDVGTTLEKIPFKQRYFHAMSVIRMSYLDLAGRRCTDV